ncbi:helix-turn-helix transcriptional regulator [Neobacillus niacini]|uniref:helix-turn-helix domain-containing protein n=1 Tax=Neobacillus niacini TaxID=86668 RepID=UPI00068AED2E|nr:helix-turn-helix transcriptional regulator [Neobacillus niacini]MEC1523512.1 helix-turn-helix transcriptional regulator [Neobacillus niacini]
MDGSILKILRIEKGLSLSKLSEQTGISKSYLSLIERNIQSNPSLEILEKLAETLDVAVEELVRREKEEKPLFCNGSLQIKSKLKLEIELSDDQLTSEKLNQIKQLIEALHSE